MSTRNECGSLLRKQTLVSFAVALFAAVPALLCGEAIAHSTVKSTSPASGSILTASPEQISIEFNEPARLTAVVAASADGSERKLSFGPANAVNVFTIVAPQLAQGRNEVRWTALSKDGHPIKGTIIIVVKPAGAR